ncbi:outer membrane protein assembly factor BamE [Arhodomonas sp. AD133]|uniref:outer membrane protein assembly factor BamE n=1 Tax=Arhodomonas sp. AD133 TaxID=3415009 RepID=UPI003EB967CD
MRLVTALYISALLLGGCSINRVPFVYDPDLQQGTLIEQADVAQLEPGMSRDQVRFLLGTPTVDDPFHAQRWDYVYYFVPGDDLGGEPAHRQLTVFFDGDELVGAEGSFIEPGNPLHGRRAAGNG